MIPIITVLLQEPDNCELIRDQIAGIIALEGANQFTLAQAAGRDDAKDFNIAAYIENARPWEMTGDEGNSPFPLVNVSLEKTTLEPGSSQVNVQKYKGIFNIDCYGCGNFSGESGDDRNATLKAWKLARVVRRILSAAEYTYLGLRAIGNQQVVNSRKIEKIETGSPGNMGDSAVAVIISRITMTVIFYESAPQSDGVEMEPMTIACEDSSGKVLFDF